MGFDPCNRPLKIRESIGTLTNKMGIHLRVWRFIPSHFFVLPWAWDVIPRLPLLARNLSSPCLGHEPKVKVATSLLFSLPSFMVVLLWRRRQQLLSLPSSWTSLVLVLQWWRRQHCHLLQWFCCKKKQQ